MHINIILFNLYRLYTTGLERFGDMIRYFKLPGTNGVSNAISFWIVQKRTQTSANKKWKIRLFYVHE